LLAMEGTVGLTEAQRQRAPRDGTARACCATHFPARPTARPLPAGAGPRAVCVVLHLDGSATRRLQAAQGAGAGRCGAGNAACSWPFSWRARRCKSQRAQSLMAACLPACLPAVPPVLLCRGQAGPGHDAAARQWAWLPAAGHCPAAAAWQGERAAAAGSDVWGAAVRVAVEIL
jgi:hypothetical protein